MTNEEQAAVSALMKQIKSPVIVELGAHTGEDGPLFEQMIAPGEQLLHVMVEPDPANFSRIESNANRPLSEHRRLIRGAIAAERDQRMFHFSFDSRDGARGSGSLLEPTGHLEHFPTIKFDAGALVECFPLDHIFFWHQLPKIDLLWVDIQGAEREMIAGGAAALARSRYCFMEAEEIELYRGQALKSELIALLAGWRLIGDFGCNILLENTRFVE